MATRFITVSIDIMHNSELNQSQKFILAEIEQLSSLEKGCIASNEHFSTLIGITRENVSKNINDLKKKGYISVFIENGTRNHKRIISLIKTVRLTETVNPPCQNDKPPLSKQQETKENTTNNKTSNNIEDHFNLVWKLYPLKKGKGKISLSKKKVMSNFTVDQWKIIIKRYDSSVLDKTFLMHGSSFFNGGYLDYTDENYQEQKFTAEKKINVKTGDFSFKPEINKDPELNKMPGVNFMEVVKKKRINNNE